MIENTKNRKSVVKSNKLNACQFRNYTKMDYLFFLYLMTKIQRFDDFGKPLVLAKPEAVKITAKEFADAFSLDLNNSYEVLKVAITSLQTKIIQFRDLFETDTQWTLITESSFYKNGYVIIHFNEKIWHHIANLAGSFTKYKLASIANFDTLPAIRLFELLIQFRNDGYLLETLDNIKFSLSKDTYAEYKIFKRDVLKPALEELNTKHKKLNVQMIEQRENRKVSKLAFTFTPQLKTTAVKKEIEHDKKQPELLPTSIA